MPMRSLRRSAVLGLCAVPALILVPTGAQGHERPPSRHTHVVHSGGSLTDLQPTTDDATDGARAAVFAVGRGDATTVRLRVTGLDPQATGRTFGAHVHVGSCLPGDGAAAGPHYNAQVAAGAPEPEVSARTEVWLDFTVGRRGQARAVARVPFGVAPGAARSVVVHADPTTPVTGAAGARLACLPVPF